MSPWRAVLGLLSASAIVVGVLELAPSAGAAGTIGVEYSQYGVSPSSSVGLISVSIESATPLTSLDVSIKSGGTDVLDLPLSDFVVPANDGNGQFGTWTLSSPITTTQLPLGSYQVYVTAADEGGDTVTDAQAGPLYFLNVVEYPGFTYSGTTFSYDNQDATFSGMAVLLAPDGTTTPFADKTLTLAGESATPTVVTGADGSFSLTFQVTQTGNYWLYYSGDPTTESNSTNPVVLTVDSFPVTITAKLAASHVNAGAPDSLSGTATYEDGGVSKPLADTTVSLYDQPYSPGLTPTATTVTDSSGNFSFTVPTAADTDWTAATAQTLYFGLGQVSRQLTVAEPNAIKGFRAKLNAFAVVTISARCVYATSGKVRIEYAAKPGGPWLTLGKLPVLGGSSCYVDGHYGTELSGHLRARLTAAYYRAVYSASANWQAAVSQSVYLHRLLTKITSFSITPHSVAARGDITVSGRLWTATKSGRWHPYGHRKLIVVFRYQHVYYRYKREPVTNASGRFRGRFVVYASSPFFAQYDGDATHFASASKRIRITASGATAPGAALSATALRATALRLPRSSVGWLMKGADSPGLKPADLSDDLLD